MFGPDCDSETLQSFSPSKGSFSLSLAHLPGSSQVAELQMAMPSLEEHPEILIAHTQPDHGVHLFFEACVMLTVVGMLDWIDRLPT
jgi:hypothetical protein